MRFSIAALLLAGCSASWQPEFDSLESRFSPAVYHAPAPDPAIDAALLQTLDAETLVKAALGRNPEIRELRARVHAQLELVRGVGALDEPMLTLRTEELALRVGGMHGDRANVVGLEQRFPFPGTLAKKSEAVLREAESMAAMVEDRERDVAVRVRKAFIEYSATARHFEIHREHVQILSELEKISDSKFRTGAVSQQDVLKPQVELVMLRNELIEDEQRIESAKAMLNLLLGRAADASLGQPRELEPSDETFDGKELLERALQSRADLRAAGLRVKAAGAELGAAEREASLPEFTAGIEYLQMPSEPDAWTVMLGVNLPWLSGKKQADVRRLKALRSADEIAREGLELRVRADVRDAFFRVESARKSVALFKGELVPKSKQSVEVSRTSYEKDKASFLDVLDAERSLRDVKLAYTQALANYGAALADLERAVGADLRRKP